MKSRFQVWGFGPFGLMAFKVVLRSGVMGFSWAAGCWGLGFGVSGFGTCSRLLFNFGVSSLGGCVGWDLGCISDAAEVMADGQNCFAKSCLQLETRCHVVIVEF